MTTITSSVSASPSAFNFGQAAEGAAFVLAAGIVGRAFNPLDSGRFAFAQMASTWLVSAMSAQSPQPQAQWTATSGADGQADIDLGDGYSLSLNEANSEINIVNANTGETTQIWGDPHVNVDGQHVFDFSGTTTFELANGTKITINTEQYAQNPNAYVASQLTITKGAQSIVVDGISQNQLGDLSISMGNDGYALDAATRDGFVLEENGEGSGWLSSYTGEVATQADLDATLPGQAFGPGSAMPSLGELGSLLGNFLVLGLLAGGSAKLEATLDARSFATRAFADAPRM